MTKTWPPRTVIRKIWGLRECAPWSPRCIVGLGPVVNDEGSRRLRWPVGGRGLRVSPPGRIASLAALLDDSPAHEQAREKLFR